MLKPGEMFLFNLWCNKYILLTKRKAKMAGYRSSSLFVFLWTQAKCNLVPRVFNLPTLCHIINWICFVICDMFVAHITIYQYLDPRVDQVLFMG